MMEAFFLYLLKATACLIGFAVLFRLLLMKETFFRFTRVTLISGLVVCSVLPFVKIKIDKPQVFQQTVFRLEEVIQVSEAPETKQAVFTENDNSSESGQSLPINTAVINTTKVAKSITWLDILTTIYWLGFAAMFLRFVFSVIRLRQLIRKSKIIKHDGYRLVISREDVVPFSFFRYIVLSEKDYRENPEEIILHEKMHISKKHNIDVIFSELFLVLHWFNPMVWLLCRDLREIHEYEADNAVINTGIEAQKYQLLLVKKAVGERRFTSVVNSFNQSKIKNRITMMLKTKSSKWARLKVLFVVPLAVIALLAFAQPKNHQDRFIDTLERKNAADYFLSVMESGNQNSLAYLYLSAKNNLFLMSSETDNSMVKSLDLDDKTELVETFSELISTRTNSVNPKPINFVFGAENDTKMFRVSFVKEAVRAAYERYCKRISIQNNVPLNEVTGKFPLSITYTSVQASDPESIAKQVQSNPYFYWEQVHKFCKEKGIKPKDIDLGSSSNRNGVIILINAENAIMCQGRSTAWFKKEEGLSDLSVKALKNNIVEIMEKNPQKTFFVSLQHDMVTSTDFVIQFLNKVLPVAYEEALREMSQRKNISFSELKETKPLLLLYSIPRSFGVKHNVGNDRQTENKTAFQIRFSTQKGDMEELALVSGYRMNDDADLETVSLKYEFIEGNKERLKKQNILINGTGFFETADKALIALGENSQQSDVAGMSKMMDASDKFSAKETLFVMGVKY